MSDKLQLTEQAERWEELRDDRDKLCARFDPDRLLLEIRRNHGVHVFDLRDYVDNLSLAIEENMC